MDEYERQHVQGEGAVSFRDKVPVPRWMLPMFVAAPLLIFCMLAFVASFPLTQAALIALAMGLFAFFGNLLLLGLRIVLSEGGLDIHVGVRRHHIDLADIVGARLAEYRLRDYPMGRGSVKWGPKGKAFIGSLGNRQGVELTMKNGQHVFINTNDPTGLIDALKTQTGARVRVDVSADEAHELEAHGQEPASREAVAD